MHARIVIVDDRSTNLRVYAQYVAMMGPKFSAKCFHSAVDALKWLETETADLLVVDYRMPEMNGESSLVRSGRAPSARIFPQSLLLPDKIENVASPHLTQVPRISCRRR